MFDLFSLVVTTVMHFTSVGLTPIENYYNPETDDKVIAIHLFYKSNWYKNELDGCRYSGAKAFYVRDWEEVTESNGQRTVRPPEYNKTAGLATLINKRACPGKAPEAVLMTDESLVGLGDMHRGGMAAGVRYMYADMTTAKADQLPKWYDQVVGKIAAAAAKGDERAAGFMEDQKLRIAALPQSSNETPLASIAIEPNELTTDDPNVDIDAEVSDAAG